MSVAEVLQATTKAASRETSTLLLQRKCACGVRTGFSGQCEECKRDKLIGEPLHRKSAINIPGDEYEKEADHVADQVMRMPEAPIDGSIEPNSAIPPVKRQVNTNSIGVGTTPPVVQDVLASSGQPLDMATRRFFEPRLGHNLSNVRVYHDQQAATSASLINALAYTQGSQIVFGKAQYAPHTSSGRQLLAHELWHVVQIGAEGTGVSSRAHGPVARLLRRENSRLETYLIDLRALGENSVGPYGTDELVEQIFELLHGVDLSDPDNLSPITQVISETFSGSVLLQFLYFMEDRNRKERMFELSRSHSLGYGLFPVTRATVEGMSELTASIVRSSYAFLSGLFSGLSDARLNEAELRSIESNLAKSSLINVAFPVVFLSGTLLGIARDAKDTITQTIEILGNFSKFVDQIGELIHEILHNQELAQTLGEETGKSFMEKIRALVPLNPIRFTFELGQLVGPAIVYTVLSLLGVSMLTGAMIFGRLGVMLSRFPRLAKILTSISRHFRGRANEQILQRLLQGSGLSRRPPSAALLAAREALRAGTATVDDYEVLLREAVNDARDFIVSSRVLHGHEVEPATWQVMRGACGIGRDCSAASLAGMASDSVRPLRIHRFQAYNVFGPAFHKHAYSVVSFPDGRQYLLDPTFAQFQRWFSLEESTDFAIELVREGFLPLSDANVANFAAVLRRAGDSKAPSISPAEASTWSARLRNEELADLVDIVGQGQPGVAYRETQIDILDRADLLNFAVRTRTTLHEQGDPHGMVPSMEWLINRVENRLEEF
jgi:hypothetical protein